MPSSNSSTHTAATEAPAPKRGHVRRDGGKEGLPVPDSAVGNFVVTDMTQLGVVPASGYDAIDGQLVRRGGEWAAGEGRWLVEYDRG